MRTSLHNLDYCVSRKASASAKSVPADKLEEYERLVRTVPGIERKGASVPYTSMNGNMFSYLESDGTLALRLPEDARQEFMDRYKTGLHVGRGVVQKEYVDVPAALLANTTELSAYFARSVEYAKSLKPKPTKR